MGYGCGITGLHRLDLTTRAQQQPDLDEATCFPCRRWLPISGIKAILSRASALDQHTGVLNCEML